MEIKPSPRLKTKGYLVLLTITSFILLAALILHFTLPLLPDVTGSEVRFYIWLSTALTILVMWVISVPSMILWINNLAYYIESDRITVHKGILTKIQQNIPYRAITDFQLQRTLFDRALRIGTIRIQTAGQSQTPSGYEGKLSGLAGWQKLLEDLRSQVKQFHPKQSEQFSKITTGDNQLLSELLAEVRAIRHRLDNPLP